MNNLLSAILERLQQAFAVPTLSERLSSGFINLVVGLCVFLAFCLLWLFVRTMLHVGFQKTKADATTAAFVQTALKFLFLTIAVLTALDSIGIKTSAVLASLGIAGLTIGFAAKDALSNLISGVLIFLDRPFVIGDLVEIDGKYGRVDRITLRSTRIVTADGKMLAVPNTDIINRTVASYTNYPHLRLDVEIGIAVTENIANARAVLLQLVLEKPEYMHEPAPRVVVKALNDYNILLELQAWIFNEREHVTLRYALREQMFLAMNQAGIEMPFETLQIISPPAKQAETTPQI